MKDKHNLDLEPGDLVWFQYENEQTLGRIAWMASECRVEFGNNTCMIPGHRLERAAQSPVGDLKVSVDRLTDEQRMDLFRFYCKHCGVPLEDVGGRCHCSNDE